MKSEKMLVGSIFLMALVVGLIALLSGCSTTTTTTTYYRADGKTIDRIEVVESEISDANALGNYLQQVDKGCATDRSLDISRFTIGYADIGLSWFSLGGNSTRAPAKAAESDKVLGEMANVKKAGKTTLQTERLGVNTEAKKSLEATQ